VTAISNRSRPLRGSRILCVNITGSSAQTATNNLIPAKLMGGKSRNPSLMNNQTVLQIRHVTTHTNSIFITDPADSSVHVKWAM